MVDGLKVLSQISGRPQKEVNEIWEQMKANHKRLNSCKGHRFGQIDVKNIRTRRVKCQRCGGFMSVIDIGIYQKGYAHAGGNPLDVCVFV